MNSSGESGRAVPRNKLLGLCRSFLMHAATLFSFFKEFHLFMRVTRVHNESDVDLVWIPYQGDMPLNHRRLEIPPGHDMNVHFGDYKTGCPDLNIFVRVYSKIGEEGSQKPCVLTKDQIRGASAINLSLNNDGIVESRFVERADLPRGFSCCFSAPINEVIPPGNADQSAVANVTLHDSSASTRSSGSVSRSVDDTLSATKSLNMEKYNELSPTHSSSTNDGALSEPFVDNMALWLEAPDGVEKERILEIGSLSRMYTSDSSSSTAAVSRKQVQLDEEVLNLKTQLAKKNEEINEIKQSLELMQRLMLQHLKLDANQFLSLQSQIPHSKPPTDDPDDDEQHDDGCLLDVIITIFLDVGYLMILILLLISFLMLDVGLY